MSQDHQKTYADKSRRPSPNYKVNDLRSPTTFVVASCDKPDEPLGVYHTSALTPFLNGTETQSPVVPLKKRGRPRKQPLIPRGTAGENAIMSASTPPSPRRSSAVPSDVPYVEVEVTGTGIGVVQVSWSFNLAVSGEAPQFFLNALLDKTSTASYLQLSICSHQRERRNDTSNMAVMEVGLPSGYIADVDALPSILQIPKVKRVETQMQDTNVVIYFDRLDKEESCVTVPAHRIHKVARQRRAPVKVYDFYSQAKSARMFYRPHKTVLCDICDEDDCGEGCYKEETTSEESPYGSSGVTNLSNSLFSF
ncbi:CD109 antigen [Trichonephila clavipes]|nr:CD109 antigen [Trichonephila clavipes]